MAKIKKSKTKLKNNMKKAKRAKEVFHVEKVVPENQTVTTSKPIDFSEGNLFKARIKVIGIGGGGGSIVSEIGRSLEKATFVIADTDLRTLKTKKQGIKYIWFGEEFTHGLGTGVNVELAKQAAEQAKEKISENFKDQDIIIFVASLGGGLGSGATQIFAEAASQFGGITFGIFTLPFKFEGKNKARVALNALKSLRQSLNVSLAIPNEKIFKIIKPDTPMTDAFSMVNKNLISSLESLIDLIYTPGVINIDFADLRSILKGKGNSAFLNTVEESGKTRAEEICKQILVNPLLQNNSFEAEKIMFNIAGADNLSMFEVEKISRHIADLNPKAKIIFGISKNQKLKNRVRTTILMTGGGPKDEVFYKKEEPEEKQEKQAEAKKQKPRKKQKPKPKKPASKSKKPKRRPAPEKQKEPMITLPAFEAPLPAPENRNNTGVLEAQLENSQKALRRSGLEIKKAEEQEEKKKIAQEKEWEIPAFLRRVKFNK